MDLYAVEEDRTYARENRVCVKGDEDAQFSGALPGIRDQCQDRLSEERFVREGLDGMVEESRRPQTSPEQLPEEQVCEIVRLKLAHSSWGPRKIRELYLRRHGQVASESTFKRVLERAGLTQKQRRGRSTQAGRLSSGRRATAANEVWTVDFKGWWRSWGKRC